MVVCHVVSSSSATAASSRCMVMLLMVRMDMLLMGQIAVVVDRSGRPAEVVPVQIGRMLLPVKVVLQVDTVLCVTRCQTTSEVRKVVLGITTANTAGGAVS